MGQARRRGTYEERRVLAEQKASLERTQSEATMAHIRQRRSSLKHVALMGIVAALMQTPNVKSNRRNHARSKTVNE